MDEEVGRVLGALRAAGMENDTVIVLAGDHGWSRGNNNEWAKHTNFHAAVHSTLLVVDPAAPGSRRGVRTAAFAELIDLYPTIVDLLGLPVPGLCPENSTDIQACVEGVSLRPVLESEAFDGTKEQEDVGVAAEDLHGRRSAGPVAGGVLAAPGTGLVWKNATFSQWPKSDVMGYSIRTDTWRYTRWVVFDGHTYRANWTHVRGEELYDQATDPYELRNQAGDPDLAQQKAQLYNQLRLGWRAAMPRATEFSV